MDGVEGYKVFDKNWICRGKQYACPGEFEEDVELSICESGMHFCKNLLDCFDYYSFSSKNGHVAKVVAYGDVEYNDFDSKCCTNKLSIIEEIPWSDVLQIVNSGNENSGIGNSGGWNSGNRNTGNFNTGDRNSGRRNMGDINTGNFNFGNYNSGNGNSGSYNSGNYNVGNHNVGSNNYGNENTGDRNFGNFNTGDWNKSDYNTGCFMTEKQTIMMFNKSSNFTYVDWLKSEARCILLTMPKDGVRFVSIRDMPNTEKYIHDYKTDGVFLQKISFNDICKQKQKWWNNLPDIDKLKILHLPNFDAKIFKECTGIDVNKNE